MSTEIQISNKNINIAKNQYSSWRVFCQKKTFLGGLSTSIFLVKLKKKWKALFLQIVRLNWLSYHAFLTPTNEQQRNCCLISKKLWPQISINFSTFSSCPSGLHSHKPNPNCMPSLTNRLSFSFGFIWLLPPSFKHCTSPT